MASPAIIWRNPNATPQQRMWSQAHRNQKHSIYIVMRSGAKKNEWEGLPNLELIVGGSSPRTDRSKSSGTRG